jgi:hypothetical protein
MDSISFTQEMRMGDRPESARWWTVTELAHEIDMTPAIVAKWIKDKRVAARRASPAKRAQWLISDEEAQRVIATVRGY